MTALYVLERPDGDADPEWRPDIRERIQRDGAQSLADRDLLAAIIGSGSCGKSVTKLAKEVLDCVDRGGKGLDIAILKKIPGMGDAKACAIAAAIELGRRFYSVREKRITRPSDVYPLIAHYSDRKQEQFLCVSLNGAHEVIMIRQISLGLVNRTFVHPREVFADPITDRSCAVIVAHNHPSGNVEPSPEDIEITRQLRDGGDILGIPVLDHLVFCADSYYSFLEHGLIAPRQ